MTTTLEKNPIEALKDAWNELRQDNPKLRIRNAAESLGVSELELLLTGTGDNVVRLDQAHGELLQEMQEAGEVMALSRNDQVVHEKHGIYTDFKIAGKGAMGICLGDIDLRVFFGQWKHALSVTETSGEMHRKSVQFFDATGTAIHKIYATTKTNASVWDRIIARHTLQEQIAQVSIETVEAPAYPGSGKVSSEDVRAEWEALKDVHHFNAMLKRLAIHRCEALELVGEDFAKRVDIEKAEAALTLSQERQIPIMVFVGNRGIVQIHTGTIAKLLRTGPWFNVLDPGFNLHFNTEEVAAVWLVRRPTSEGIVTSVEVYNSDRDLILTLFGERKPGIEELEDWRTLVADLEQQA